MEISGIKSKWILGLLIGLVLTTTISVVGQEEPRERARRPSKVREQSSIQKEKISQTTSMFATEAARQKNGPVKVMLFLNQVTDGVESS
jgi:hypothetical protein